MVLRAPTERLLRAVRRSLGRAAELRPLSYAATLGQQNRLVAQVLLELGAAKEQGHSARLEYLLGHLHLAYVFRDDSTHKGLHQKLGPVLRSIHEIGENDVEAPTESSGPLAYFVSYPRSGNTLAMRLVANATLGQILVALRDGGTSFSKRIYPRSYPLPRLIKDHEAHRHYMNDRCVLIVRDGRDTIASLAFMTLQQRGHNFSDRGETADFIRWVSKSYAFGSWANHTKNLMTLLKGPDKLLVRYEDLSANEQTFFDVVDFFDPGNMLPREHLAKLFAERNAVVESIKAAPHVNKEWGFGLEFEPGSMFYEWSLNRKGSSWREAWDSAAKRAFHETGATEALIEFGYETDPDWWRQ